MNDILKNKIRIKVAGPAQKIIIQLPEGAANGFPENCEFRNSGGRIMMNGMYFRSIVNIPCEFSVVRGLIVGESFHWEHREDHAFRGSLEIVSTPAGLIAINELPFEYYIASVVGSEMKSECPEEFLMTQAIVARSAAYSMSKKLHAGELFDLCSDDHCQDYRGVLRETNRILDAVNRTSGEFLYYGDDIADCRFSKICGGRTSKFSDAWKEESPHPYMPEKWDCLIGGPDISSLADYVGSDFPHALCSPSETIHKGFRYASRYFRWEMPIPKDFVSGNLASFGFKIGDVLSAQPLEITSSFRIVKMKFVGKKGECILSGELNLRKVMSLSTLPSSSFVLDDKKIEWICRGAGWGHGVGMCQIGALNLAVAGYSHEFILDHYFPGCRIGKAYEYQDLEEKIWQEKRPCYERANCYEIHRCKHGKTGDGPQNCKGDPSVFEKEF
ncbi:SpoIID/LytB domain-containing protein [candidate division WOR-3 bacterium]|nr:SpoIID/LytB domain-containing protein [candidate division WOR-3 bacterium]